MNMRSLKELREELSTSNIDVVRLCEKFVDERISQERMRGDAAERRANIILGTLGASTAFMIFIASVLLEKRDGNSLVVLLYAAAALWVSRSVWYCIKTIRPQSRNRIDVKSLFNFQGKSEIDALKDIVSGKIWELQQSIQPNTERLFYAQRAQRALIIFVGILLLLGMAIMSQGYFTFHLRTCVLVIGSAIAVACLFFADYFIEKSGIWNHGSPIRSDC
jgi:hypothetical protein